MGEPKFTNGPLVARHHDLVSGVVGPEQGGSLADVHQYGTTRAAREERKANAHLFAAAPELYEMTALLKRCVEYDIKRSLASGDDEGANLKSLTLAQVDAVLAKARGEQ